MQRERLRRGVWRMAFRGSWSLVDGQWLPMLLRRWKDKGKRSRRKRNRQGRHHGK